MQTVYVSLGSNIDPAENFERMVASLLTVSNRVDLSRVITTTPVGFISDRVFYNACARLHTEMDLQALKQRFNEIELMLGRDRTDPTRKRKDRPADLDILFALPAGAGQVGAALLPPEPYVRPLLLELLAFVGVECPVAPSPLTRGVGLRIDDQAFGRMPTTIEVEPAHN